MKINLLKNKFSTVLTNLFSIFIPTFGAEMTPATKKTESVFRINIFVWHFV